MADAALHRNGADRAEPDDAVVQAASAWHVRLQEDGSVQVRAEFERWLAQHPSHGLAYARMEAIWARFAQVQPQAARKALAAGLDGKGGRRRALAAVFAVALCGLVAWMALGGDAARYLLADARTGTGERRTVVLDDGSRITLNTDSAIDVDIDATARRIRLLRGEVLLEVASDASRPFTVISAEGTARALGTRYVVRQLPGETRVGVIESRVRACATPPASCVDLEAGQAVSLGHGHAGEAGPFDADALTSWTEGVLAVDDRPLAVVLDELRRYRPGVLSYDAAALEGLSVSGVFPLDDTDRALDALSRALPLRITHYTRFYVRIERR